VINDATRLVGIWVLGTTAVAGALGIVLIAIGLRQRAEQEPTPGWGMFV